MCNVKKWRKARAMTQGELAQTAGVSKFTVCRVEAGLKIRASTLRKIAAALDCDPVDLLEPPNPSRIFMREALRQEKARTEGEKP